MKHRGDVKHRGDAFHHETAKGIERRKRILQAVADYQDLTGWHPTVREIGQRVGLKSPHPAHYNIRRLIQLGLLKQNDTHSQLRITEAGRAELPIPYLPTSKVKA